MNTTRALVLCTFYILTKISGNVSNLYTEEIRSLSELPLDKLIQIKSSLSADNGFMDAPYQRTFPISSKNLSLTLPLALPLKRTSKHPTRRYEDHYEDKGKDTKISKIFQLAVTTLSFLAFGGYLLTLIITAIKRSSTNQGMGNVIVFSNLQSLQNLQKFKRPKRNVLIFDPMENDFATDRLYEGMIMLSRSYAQYSK